MPSAARRRIYLISPRYKFSHYAAQRELCRLLGKHRISPPGALPLVAALTPPGWEVRIIDDENQPLVLEPRPDLVGITTLSATSERCTEIAAIYRALGIPVVFGGPWATFRTEEALQHADHVVVGEAEGAWQRLLGDLERGKAARIYRNDELPAFRTSPIPRWDLCDIEHTMTVAVETSRGCPFACQFCVVHKMFGRTMRFRDPDDVVREIRAAPIKRIFFVADNFAIDKEYARALVRKLMPLRISWVCQTSIQVADDPEFLREMAAAGCISVLIGFESLNKAALRGVRKTHNRIETFERAIRNVHAAGMHVLASFIVGFDEDTLETFSVIRDFVERNDLVFPMINSMSVAPGTAIYERMAQEGRIEVVEPAFRNGIFPCMHYFNFSQREMLDEFFATLFALFDWQSITRRAVRLFSRGEFSRPSTEQVSLAEKIRTSAVVLRRFALSRDPHKRALLGELLRLIRQGKLAPDKAIIFLLDMQAFSDFLADARSYLPEVRARVGRIDQGPWRARSRPGSVVVSVFEGCSGPGAEEAEAAGAEQASAPEPS